MNRRSRRAPTLLCLAAALVLGGCAERGREATPEERSLAAAAADTLLEGEARGRTPVPPGGPSGPSELLRTLHQQADLAAFMEGFRLAAQARNREGLLRIMTPRFALDGAEAGEDARFEAIAELDRAGGWATLDSLLAVGWRREPDGDVVFPGTWKGAETDPHGRLVPTPPAGWIWVSYRRPAGGSPPDANR